jgi:preprotein translocase subunit SecE
MARQTRQQRRQRRSQEPALAGGTPPRPPERPPVAKGDSEPSRRESREERQSQGSGPLNFIRESWAELKKVEWPDRQTVISGTAVVIIACAIVGTYLWLNDRVWQYVVQHVLLR